jgi:hypothetical protein
MMMNNLRENSVGLFNTSDPDPLKWNKLGVIKDPLWKGMYPNPFHMGFTHDSKKGYFVVLRPPPGECSPRGGGRVCVAVRAGVAACLTAAGIHPSHTMSQLHLQHDVCPAMTM